MELEELLAAITPADKEAMEGCRKNWDAIAKPINGLGNLEDMLVQVAGATGKTDLSLGAKAVAVFCADNGVWPRINHYWSISHIILKIG